MALRYSAAALSALTALILSAGMTRSEMGPCSYNGQESSYCGEGDGAAKIVPNTTSPSRRLALAWRMTDRPPTARPDEDDPKLESLVVRIADGAMLVRSPGVYWNIGDRTAKAALAAAWSPDSRFLIKKTSPNERPEHLELFAFADNDGVTGPFDLVKVLQPAARASMGDVADGDDFLFNTAYQPLISIDDSGLIAATVFMSARNSNDVFVYDINAQATRTADALVVEVRSIERDRKPYISVTIH